MNKKLSSQLNKQREAKKKWRARRSPRNYARYKDMVDCTSAMLKEAKQSWWDKEISKLEVAPQIQKWKILNKLTNPGFNIAIQPVKVAGKYVFTDEDILAEMENVHVKKATSNDVEVLDDELVHAWTKEANSNLELDDWNADITYTEVTRTFDSGSNTPGPDGVSAIMIDKAHRELMTECLWRLWSKVWSTSNLPKRWKLEHRILLPKPGKENYNDCSSYRTISITDILGKRLEKVISARLVSKLEYQDFDDSQFAYLKKRSSTQAVLALVDMIRKNMLNSNVVGVVFFDFSDAFGSVNRVKLLHKLKLDFGISGRLWSYLVSFLSGRRARITVNQLVGEWLESLYGTSAGTMLGPILFLAHVHDTPSSVSFKFADDLVSTAVAKDISGVQVSLQEVMDQLADWAHRWDMQLNVSKTKVMLFGAPNQSVDVTIQGRPVEQVPHFKYLGVWVDEKLSFTEQADYAASKAIKAFSKVARLIECRKGISPHIGIMLYKCLVRPHLEYAIAAWACMNESSLQTLERVQSRCLRTVLGAKAHASSEAIDTIANVVPFRLRLQQICTLEYARIMQRPSSNKIRLLMEESSSVQQPLTAMAYVKHQARSLFFTDNVFMEESHNSSIAEILDNIIVTRLDVVGEGCSTLCSSQAVHRVESFIHSYEKQSMICFTDAATSEAEVGTGSAAVIILPLDSEAKVMEFTEVIPKITDNIEAEITALAVALEAASELHRSVKVSCKKESVIILSDCKSAINMLIQRPYHSEYHAVLQRVRVGLQVLHSQELSVSVGWIPGHSGIEFNELADSLAKSALEKATLVSHGSVSLPACKRLVIKQVHCRWQQRWNRSVTGRVTHSFIPQVGRKSYFPPERCVAVSYIRLLLDDTTLNDHMHRCGLADSRQCDCGNGVEDAFHFLFKCPAYLTNRNRLFSNIQELLSVGDKPYAIPMSVMFLLSPGQYDDFAQIQCEAILNATFTYIQSSERRL